MAATPERIKELYRRGALIASGAPEILWSQSAQESRTPGLSTNRLEQYQTQEAALARGTYPDGNLGLALAGGTMLFDSGPPIRPDEMTDGRPFAIRAGEKVREFFEGYVEDVKMLSPERVQQRMQDAVARGESPVQVALEAVSTEERGVSAAAGGIAAGALWRNAMGGILAAAELTQDYIDATPYGPAIRGLAAKAQGRQNVGQANFYRAFRQALSLGSGVDTLDPETATPQQLQEREMVLRLRQEMEARTPGIIKMAERLRTRADENVVETFVADMAFWAPIGYLEGIGVARALAPWAMRGGKARKVGVVATDLLVGAADAYVFTPGDAGERATASALTVGLGAGLGAIGGSAAALARKRRAARPSSARATAPDVGATAPDVGAQPRPDEGPLSREPFFGPTRQRMERAVSAEANRQIEFYAAGNYTPGHRDHLLTELNDLGLDSKELPWRRDALVEGPAASNFDTAVRDILQARGNRITQELAEQLRGVQREFRYLAPEDLDMVAQKAFDLRFRGAAHGVDVQLDVRVMGELVETVTEDLRAAHDLPSERVGTKQRLTGRARAEMAEGTATARPAVRIALDLVADPNPGKLAKTMIHETAEVWVAMLRELKPDEYRRLAANVRDIYARAMVTSDPDSLLKLDDPRRMAELFVKLLENESLLRQTNPAGRGSFFQTMAKRYGGWAADLMGKVREWRRKYLRIQRDDGTFVGGSVHSMGHPSAAWSKELMRTAKQFREGRWDEFFSEIQARDRSVLLGIVDEASEGAHQQYGASAARASTGRLVYTSDIEMASAAGLERPIATSSGVRRPVRNAVETRNHQEEVQALAAHPELEGLLGRVGQDQQAVEDFTARIRDLGAELDADNAAAWRSLRTEDVAAVVAAVEVPGSPRATLTRAVRVLTQGIDGNLSAAARVPQDVGRVASGILGARPGKLHDADAAGVLTRLADADVPWARDLMKLKRGHPHRPAPGETWGEFLTTLPRSDVAGQAFRPMVRARILSGDTAIAAPPTAVEQVLHLRNSPQVEDGLRKYAKGDDAAGEDRIAQHNRRLATHRERGTAHERSLREAQRQAVQAGSAEARAAANRRVRQLEMMAPEPLGQPFIFEDGLPRPYRPNVEETLYMMELDGIKADELSAAIGRRVTPAEYAEARRLMLEAPENRAGLADALGDLEQDMARVMRDAADARAASPRKMPPPAPTAEMKPLTGGSRFDIETDEDAFWRAKAEAELAAEKHAQEGNPDLAEANRKASVVLARQAETLAQGNAFDGRALRKAIYEQIDADAAELAGAQLAPVLRARMGNTLASMVRQITIDRFEAVARVDETAADALNKMVASRAAAAVRSDMIYEQITHGLSEEQVTDLVRLGLHNRHMQILRNGYEPRDGLPRLSDQELERIKGDKAIQDAVRRYKESFLVELEKMRALTGLQSFADVEDGFFLPLFVDRASKLGDEFGRDTKMVATGAGPRSNNPLTRGVRLPRTKGARRAKGSAEAYVTDLRALIRASLDADMKTAQGRIFIHKALRDGVLLRKRPKNGRMVVNGKEYAAVPLQVNPYQKFRVAEDAEIRAPGDPDYIPELDAPGKPPKTTIETRGETYYAPPQVVEAWHSATQRRSLAITTPGLRQAAEFMDFMLGVLFFGNAHEAAAHTSRLLSKAITYFMATRARDLPVALSFVGPRAKQLRMMLRAPEADDAPAIERLLIKVGQYPERALEEVKGAHFFRSFLFGRPSKAPKGKGPVTRTLVKAAKATPLRAIWSFWGYDVRARMAVTKMYFEHLKATGRLPEGFTIEKWADGDYPALDADFRTALSGLGNYNAEMQTDRVFWLRKGRLSPFAGGQFSMRVQELENLFGKTNLPREPGKLRAMATWAQAVTMSTIASLAVRQVINLATAGKPTWENDAGHETDVHVGTDKDGAPIYLDERFWDPALQRAMRTAGVTRFLDKRSPRSASDFVLDLGEGLFQEGVTATIGSPGMQAILIGATGAVPYWLRRGYRVEQYEVTPPALDATDTIMNRAKAIVANSNPYFHVWFGEWLKKGAKIQDEQVRGLAWGLEHVIGPALKRGRTPLADLAYEAHRAKKPHQDFLQYHVISFLNTTDQEKREKIVNEYLNAYPESQRPARAIVFNKQVAGYIRSGLRGAGQGLVVRSQENQE